MLSFVNRLVNGCAIINCANGENLSSINEYGNPVLRFCKVKQYKRKEEKMEKIIKDFPNYTVSESGEIFSYQKEKKKLKSFVSHNGYAYVDLCKNGKKERKAIHRLVGQYFVEGYFENAVINHKDSNTLNNNFSNLEWVTQTENIHKGYEHSGVGAKRNYLKYKIVYPSGKISEEEFLGFPDLKDFLESKNIKLSFTSLQKYGTTKNYKIIKYK